MQVTQHIKKLAVAGLFMGLIPATHAQFITNNYKRAADNFYAKGDYFSAAQYYEKCLTDNGKKTDAEGYEPYLVQKQGGTAPGKKTASSRSEVVYRLGESYYQVHDYTHAAQWLSELTATTTEDHPEWGYYYGVSLRANGSYDEAIKVLQAYVEAGKGEHLDEARRELANLQFIQQQNTAAGSVEVSKLNGNINMTGANYAATWMDANTLVFTSTREEADGTAYFNRLYTTSAQMGEATALALPHEKGQHQGTASFMPGGKKLFITQWMVDKKGNKSTAIYTSEQQEDGSWSTPARLGTAVNAADADTRQPRVTEDGKYLLFASNRSGGQGGFDIWYAPLDAAGNPGEAINAGPAINTAGDEQAPFYHAKEETLVFASNGLVGMGGFDLYAAKGTLGGAWTTPQNLGAPVNSVKDDIYFTSKGNRLLEEAFISSDRASLCCLELFTVNKTYQQYLYGKVVDCATQKPLSGVEILVKSNTGARMGSQTTNNNGEYTITVLPGAGYSLAAAKGQYENAALAVPAPASGKDTVYNNVICLTPVKAPEPVIVEEEVLPEMHDLRFAFGKAIPEASSYAYLDDLVAYLAAHPATKIEIAGYTDGIGDTSYNNELSQKRADACRDYLLKKGIAADRVIAKGYGECCAVESEKTPEGKDDAAARRKNRRVEFRIIR